MASDGRRESGSVTLRPVLGLLIVALGGIFLADNLGFVDAHEVMRLFWPGALVLIGLVVLLQPPGRSHRYWGLVWVVAGVWVYGHQQGWIEVDFWQIFFPGVLILFGASLVLRSIHGARPRRADGAEDRDAYTRAFAVMAGNVRRSVSSAFRGAELTAVMGGVHLDLTGARLEGEEALVDVFAFWGGIEIRVPPDWAVVSRVTPLMAGYEDKTRPAAATAPARRLVVRGLVVMGGVEVKN
jgi:predicted membrane protein